MSIRQANGEDKIASHPQIINQEQKITLLVSMVARMDTRQQELIAGQKAMTDQLQHIIDQNDRIIAALLPPGA